MFLWVSFFWYWMLLLVWMRDICVCLCLCVRLVILNSILGEGAGVHDR